MMIMNRIDAQAHYDIHSVQWSFLKNVFADVGVTYE